MHVERSEYRNVVGTWRSPMRLRLLAAGIAVALAALAVPSAAQASPTSHSWE